jgi:hypothetical protein
MKCTDDLCQCLTYQSWKWRIHLHVRSTAIKPNVIGSISRTFLCLLSSKSAFETAHQFPVMHSVCIGLPHDQAHAKPVTYVLSINVVWCTWALYEGFGHICNMKYSLQQCHHLHKNCLLLLQWSSVLDSDRLVSDSTSFVDIYTDFSSQ